MDMRLGALVHDLLQRRLVSSLVLVPVLEAVDVVLVVDLPPSVSVRHLVCVIQEWASYRKEHCMGTVWAHTGKGCLYTRPPPGQAFI